MEGKGGTGDPRIVSLGFGMHAWSVGVLGSVGSNSKTWPNIKSRHSLSRGRQARGLGGRKGKGAGGRLQPRLEQSRRICQSGTKCQQAICIQRRKG